ncbi:hypothetical protein [Pararhodobacter zhoushanensis]|uniref:Uncharacterized protein n=1 Tax=Pararhodobacter zhoushanensis TaxID=2479545 RepID=A0ABT3GYI8_9RHOB|nr:hypothetical protein [Pararhodobacter zhoushanensis]MCW1932598.1 hypothetical protein [Pararhodobacter zhoushanensis]
MARNGQVPITDVWTQLTNDDVTSITFQNVSGYGIYVQVTVGETPPATGAQGILYNPYSGERNADLADLAPGIAGTRIYARTGAGQSGIVWVSHA